MTTKTMMTSITTEPMIIRDTITKEEINQMPRVGFTGSIRVLETPQDIERAVAYLRTFPALGIDTETRPSFKRGQNYQVALLQVATDDVCYLIRLCKSGLTLPVIQLLENPDILKIGLSLRDDFMMLQKRSPFQPRHYVELQEHACAFGIQEKSLQKIYAILFGQKISKAQRLSNWEADTLSHPQQEYAAIDAWACLHIYHKLEELRRTGDFTIQKTNKEEICTESI